MRMHTFNEWLRKHRFIIDCAGATLLWLALALPMLGSGILDFLVSTLLIAPLAWRRTQPVAAGSVIAGVAILQVIFGMLPMPANITVILTVYALSAYAPRWASKGGLGLALLGGILFVLRYELGLISQEVATKLPSAVVIVILIWSLVFCSWALGDLKRTRRLREQALEERAWRLEIEQQQERDLAASDERAHIAREMHDIVAHSLSVIIAQADGARYAADHDPVAAPKALATIADTGRTSLREMRRLLGVLRSDHGDEPAPTRPLPGLEDIPDLLEGFRSSGLSVESTDGSTALRALPAGAELTVYRIVQEGLTNALKHGGPQASAWLTFGWDQRGLQIELCDDGRGAAAEPTGPYGGNGLRGMAERVRLYDGSLEAGPRTSGGFRIRAFIPYTEA
ncbi:histidine kinase [Acaricomes phytoseiuli]|uniref:sensor histidine kinase n=1 Tax=Acaricomes phytoseiuli TaxID=291968 RepID=UPI000476E443|nr:histidine kinase [Acaricomes phytoseiuli]MCW1250463.1 histidine kinase [Acaricomes phytoseiuli]